MIHIYLNYCYIQGANNTVVAKIKIVPKKGGKQYPVINLKNVLHAIRMKEVKLVGPIVNSGKTIKYVPRYDGVNFKEELLALRPALWSWNIYRQKFGISIPQTTRPQQSPCSFSLRRRQPVLTCGQFSAWHSISP